MIRKKKYRFRKKRKFYREKWFWLFMLSLIFLLGFFYLLLFSSIFAVKKIEIFGLEKLAASEIESFVKNYLEKRFFIFSSKSIFLLNVKKIQENLLKKFLLIESLNLKRKLPNILIIKIEEKKPIAIICQEEISQKCFFLDREGIIFEEVKKENENYLIIKSPKKEEIRLGEKVIEKESLVNFLEIKELLQKEIGMNLENISQESEKKIIAKLIEGWEIYFNSKEDLKKQIRNLSLVLENEIPPQKRKNLEYVDLRFGNRVFYKFK